MRPARVLLSADALRHNFARVRSFAPLAQVMAVVKANGYGHGLSWTARTLREADAFGVASVEEGAALRDAGIRQPVVLLEGFFHPEELPALVRFRLDAVVHHESQLWDLEHAPPLDEPVDVWLKIDTGMHRIGFNPDIVPEVVRRLKTCMAAGRVRVMSHFPSADNRFDTTAPYQVRQFEELSQNLNVERSLANSAGVVNWPSSHFEWVRPGIMLYGGTPGGKTAEAFGLKPAMTLSSEIIAVQHINQGDAIGYGSIFVADKPMTIGVVACGYADGYPRRAPEGTPIVVDGVRTRLVGRVSMDMLTVDLTPVPNPHVGSKVTIWGEGMPIEDVAQASGTVGYELMCALSLRVPVRDKIPA